MENIGFLQIVARTANGALPIENAKINIFEYSPNDEKSPNSNILYSLLTDESGKTPKVALPAKNKNLSLTPDNEHPFTVYNIVASKEGYYDNSYINVPIFQGITAIQPVDMIPLIEYGKESDDYPDSTIRFNETPNTDL